ncbi:hypothetical protein JCM11641_007698 [Rhodosporidiobolus odoratus]
MATLERPSGTLASTTDGTTLADTASFSPTGVPSPFPERGREQSRGRPSAVGAASPRLNGEKQASSRSPGGTQRSLSRVVEKVKRAMSSSRESQAGSQERGRRGSVESGIIDEPRGRSPLSAALSPRSISRSRNDSIPENGIPAYPLSQQQTRSSSRGRTLQAAGGKVFSTGRGGAGNMLGLEKGEIPYSFDGEEDPSVVDMVRTDRSKSRERAGRPEIATSGRGGRGNIRSSSRQRDLELGRVPTVMEEQERYDQEDEALREAEILKRREREGPERWVSSGRGGAGNFFSPRRRQSDA